MPAFQDTDSTFCKRFLYQCATDFATDFDDEISTSSNSSSTTTYTELPELEDNGNMYFNIVKDDDSGSDEKLQKLKGIKIYPSEVKINDLVEDVEEEDAEDAEEKEEKEENDCIEETQEEYELRTQTGIFDWPKVRLNEDECNYFGIFLDPKLYSDPY